MSGQKTSWIAAVVALALTGAFAGLGAQTVAGTWVLGVTLDAGSGDATFVLEVDGNEITGTYSGTLGEQPVTGTVEGTTVRLSFTVDQVGEVTFGGTVEGDTMRGRCEYGALGSGSFSGSRSGP